MESNNLFKPTEASLSTLTEIKAYRSRRTDAYLLVDTNILLLFLIGFYDSRYLPSCPLMTDNGKNYELAHFELLKEIFSIFQDRIAITPHVLSEISMLRKRVEASRRDKYLAAAIEKLEKCKEHQVPFSVLSKNGALIQFGFTDISLVEAAREKNWIILTDEFHLHKDFKEHVPVVYFSNLVTYELVFPQGR